jgi:hypothetical protein
MVASRPRVIWLGGAFYARALRMGPNNVKHHYISDSMKAGGPSLTVPRFATHSMASLDVPALLAPVLMSMPAPSVVKPTMQGSVLHEDLLHVVMPLCWWKWQEYLVETSLIERFTDVPKGI